MTKNIVEELRGVAPAAERLNDRAADEIDLLRTRLRAVLAWTDNWTVPFEGEDEWREDKRLARAALRGLSE